MMFLKKLLVKFKKMNKNKGFTLIELLVVIAIIGILSSVVLASLSSARNKGKDAAVKSQLASMKAQAELYFSAHEDVGYAGLCASTTDGVNKLLVAAHGSSASATSGPVINGGVSQVALQTVCNDGLDGWAVSVPLSVSGQFFCSDNAGLSRETAGLLGTGVTAIACQ